MNQETATPEATPEPVAAPEPTEAQNGEALDAAIAVSEEEQGPIADAPEADIQALSEAEIQDDIINSEENYKGIDYNQVVQGLPEDARKIVANLRRSYTTKSQEVAAERKKLDATAANLASQIEALIQSDFFEDLKERSTSEEVAGFDPYDPDSVEKRIEKEVAVRLRQMLEPMHAEHRIQQQRNQVTAFKQEHPDLEDMTVEVAQTLRDNEHLTLEQAYWQVKGRVLATNQEETESELKKYRKAAKEAGLKVGGTSRGRSRGIPKYVQDQGAVAIYQWLEANPHIKV